MEERVYNKNELEYCYNAICGAYIHNLMVKTIQSNITMAADGALTINLEHFNPKDEEHIFYFEIVKIVYDMLSIGRINMKNDFFTRFGCWWKNRKRHKFYRLPKKGTICVDVVAELNQLRPYVTQLMGENFNLGMIYHEFYEGRKS